VDLSKVHKQKMKSQGTQTTTFCIVIQAFHWIKKLSQATSVRNCVVSMMLAAQPRSNF